MSNHYVASRQGPTIVLSCDVKSCKQNTVQIFWDGESDIYTLFLNHHWSLNYMESCVLVTGRASSNFVVVIEVVSRVLASRIHENCFDVG